MKKRKIEILKWLKKKLEQLKFPGSGFSLYQILAILRRKLVTFDLDQRAAAVSFSLLLAVFPAIIFVFTLIPYVPIKNLDQEIMVFLQDLLPAGIYKAAATTILEIVSKRRVDILSFGFIFTAIAATNGMMALMRAFNMALHQRERRSYLKARGIALFLTGMLIIVLLSAIVILIVGNILIDFFQSKNMLSEDIYYYLIESTRYLSIFFIFFLGICVIYYFGPAISRKIRFFNTGAIIAAILCIFITNAFSYYLTNFNSYNRLYGSIGTLIGLMVWIYLISLILILGFEINISIRYAKSGIEQKTKTPQQSGARGVSK